MSTQASQWRPRAVRGRDYALPDDAWWSYRYLAPHPVAWRDLDPERVFDALIWDRPTVCSDCFHRIRDTDEGGETVAKAGRLSTGKNPGDTLIRAGTGVVGQDARQHDDYGVLRVNHGQLYCGECGRAGGRARDGPMSLDEALDRVPTLLERFAEEFIAIDPDVVYDVVRHGKTSTKWRGHNRAIFAAAVKLGVRRARD